MTELDEIRREYARRDAAVDPQRYSKQSLANAIAREERGDALRIALRHHGVTNLENRQILEVGCGSGGELELLVELGASADHLHGIDFRGDAVAAAEARVPGAHLVAGDARFLPYADASFDLVYQATALSSMLSRAMRAAVAAEMRRVARPGGLIVSYDFVWNPLNRHTVGIGRRELQRLFPGTEIELQRVTLAPPIGRWVARRSTGLLHALARVSILKSHRLAIVDVPG